MQSNMEYLDRNSETSKISPFSANDILLLIENKEWGRGIKPKLFKEGDPVYHLGDASTNAYIIHTGRIKLLNYLDNGKIRIIRLHNAGNILGIEGLVEPFSRHTAVAMGSTLTTEIPLTLLNAMEKSNPDKYCWLLKILHRYLLLADTWITEFSTGGIRERVARLLLFLSDSTFPNGNRSIAMPKTEEIAEILGITPESASRTTADFKRQHIIDKVNQQGEKYRVDTKRLVSESSATNRRGI